MNKLNKIANNLKKLAEPTVYHVTLDNIDWETDGDDPAEYQLPSHIVIDVSADSEDDAYYKALEKAGDKYSFLINSADTNIVPLTKQASTKKAESELSKIKRKGLTKKEQIMVKKNLKLNAGKQIGNYTVGEDIIFNYYRWTIYDGQAYDDSILYVLVSANRQEIIENVPENKIYQRQKPIL